MPITSTLKMMLTNALLSILLLAVPASGFAPQPVMRYASMSLNAELIPEPEGGEVLTALGPMPDTKVKNMGEAKDVDCDEGIPYQFWLQAVVKGSEIQDLNKGVLRDAAKKANFPGFRKGQVPPYAMPQIRTFSVQEGIVQTCRAVVEAYGLKAISGKKGEVEILEDIPEMAKTYKLGDDVEFTASLTAIFVKKEESESEEEEQEPAAAESS